MLHGAAAAGSARLAGAAYFDTGGAVEVQGDMARLSSGSVGGHQLSYALYRFDASGVTPQTLLIDAYFNLCPADAAGAYWLGLGDYSKGRWSWQGPLSGSPQLLTLNVGGYLSPAGNFVVAIVAFNGASFYLSHLAIDADVLEVGSGQPYSMLEDAYQAAPDSATILVHPQAGGAPYVHPALQVYKPGIAFRGVIEAGARVKLDGAGFNYTGAGSTPRAIFQFNPGADGGSIAGFELYNASNDTYNGAGVRINQANNVLVRNCDIHNDDMGIMSNGSVSADTARGQRIEFCRIANNGSLSDPGYNHNLYLGGKSVQVCCCEIAGSLTGHNLKSRAHFNLVEFCYIHDSANRELDLVDDTENTAAAESHSVVVGNVIVKDPNCPGNRAVIHFGQDGGGDHNGTLYLVHNTIVTPFISPVVTLSAASAGAAIWNNIVWDEASGQSGQSLISAVGGAQLGNATGGHNWLAAGQTIPPGTNIDDGSNYHAASGEEPALRGRNQRGSELARLRPGRRGCAHRGAGAGLAYVELAQRARTAGADGAIPLPLPPMARAAPGRQRGRHRRV